ncbi:MMPL family transporter [Brevibacterium sp. 91QC2O2]|uniref:MMPL family transporter n=1 Tax=Brevibacterium TaxID=1696 RepID=UPI00211BCEAB|nr:MMPL family transporter [Brevibacterium sp. 91QC2O2]MCQ9386392.1 MMPL family transporter [Brevibacterium sp. 68QC2CO]
MSSFLYELGRRAFRHKKTVLATWLIILVAIGGFVGAFSKPFADDFTLPGSEAQEALDSMKLSFPQASGASAQIIIVAPDGQRVDHNPYKQEMKDAAERIGDLDHVETASAPFNAMIEGGISDDKSAAIINISYDTDRFNLPDDTQDKLQAQVDELQNDLPKGSQVEPGGEVFQMTGVSMGATEVIGVVIAFFVLAITFGSFLAAGLPLITAIVGVGVGMLILVSMTAFTTVSSTSPTLAAMLGLAVGIDYALFIVSRARQNMRHGQDPEEATAQATATAGSAVIFAGTTVIIALVGLSIVRMSFLTIMGVAAAITVAVAVLVALTLVPTLLGFLGTRVDPHRKVAKRAQKDALAQGASKHEARAAGERALAAARIRAAEAYEAAQAHQGAEDAAPAGADARTGAPASAAEPAGVEQEGAALLSAASAPKAGGRPRKSFAERFYGGWVKAATKVPILTIVVIVVGLGLFAIPASKIQLAMPNNGTEDPGTPARVTYDLTTEHFGEGFNGPLIMLADGLATSDEPMDVMDDMKADIEKVPGVVKVLAAVPNQNADTGMIQIVPQTGPSDPQTEETVQALRDMKQHFKDDYGVDTSVTGATALYSDISAQLGRALLPFGAFVVGLSFILLMMVFRSIAVPIKATLGFLLSVVTSFGIISLVFVQGHGASLIGVDQAGPVISFLPIIVMGILFGLAMDYEVFLVSGMREAYAHGASAKQAILRGFTGSAAVVTGAAIIMFSVFFAFVPEGAAIIKSIGLSLAVGVFTDAFIVRMTLVPAVMALLGDKAWWIPKWLDKILPHFDVEGEGLYHQVKLKDFPVKDSPYAVYGEGLSLGTKRHPIFENVDVALKPGEVLGITGHGTPGLVLALSGRAKLDGGELKVGPYVLPEQANKIRNSTPYLNMDPAEDAMVPALSKLEQLAAKPPKLLVVDRADQSRDPQTAQAVRTLVGNALTSGSAVVLGLTNPKALQMLPAEVVLHRLDLDAMASGGPRGEETEELTMNIAESMGGAN